MSFSSIVASVSLSILLALATPASIAKASVSLSLTMDSASGMVTSSAPVTVTALLQNSGKKPVHASLQWKTRSLEFPESQTNPANLLLEPGKKTQAVYRVSLPKSGFANVECIVSTPSGKALTQRIRIGRQPEGILFRLTKEPDFDAFWAKALASLKSVAPRYKVMPRPERSSDKADVYEVEMRSYGDVRVRGWLETPKAKGVYPVVIRVPGYGADMQPVGNISDMIVFSFNPRAHGNSQQDVPGKPNDYWLRGLDDKNSYFYKGAMLDCLRAIDYVASRPDVDAKRIAVWGGSQGGGLSLAMAALDPRVRLCAADFPFLCDWENYFKLTHWPAMDAWVAKRKKRSWTTTLKTLSYFDAMNLASRIRCPVIMGIGLQDPVCPPTTSFAMFNRIPAQKSYRIYRNAGHGVYDEHYPLVWNWIRKAFRVGLTKL